MIERHKKWTCDYHGGGVYVYNRENLILEQYPFEVKQTAKGRGALICETSQGLKILKEYRGSEGRADFLYRLLQFLSEHGQERVDCIVRTREEKTLARDVDGTAYMVRSWYEGRECDTKSREDIYVQFASLPRYIIFSGHFQRRYQITFRFRMIVF